MKINVIVFVFEMNNQNHFTHAEISKLILGYLLERNLPKSFNTFLRECPDLTYYWQLLRTGQNPQTRLAGYSLIDILNEFAEYKVFALAAKKQPPAQTVQHAQPNVQAILEAEEKEKLNKEKKKAYDQKRDWRKSSESRRKCQHPERKTINGNEKHDPNRLPVISSLAVVDNISNGNNLNTDPPCADSRQENGRIQNLNPLLVQSGQQDKQNFNSVTVQHDAPIETSLGFDLNSDEGTKSSKIDFLDKLLEETHIHEKLAANINKVIHLNEDGTRGNSPIVPSTFTQSQAKQNASVKDLDTDINQIIEWTESDPTFQNFLKLFQQTMPVNQFEVTDIEVSNLTDRHTPETYQQECIKESLEKTDCVHTSVENVNSQVNKVNVDNQLTNSLSTLKMSDDVNVVKCPETVSLSISEKDLHHKGTTNIPGSELLSTEVSLLVQDAVLAAENTHVNIYCKSDPINVRAQQELSISSAASSNMNGLEECSPFTIKADQPSIGCSYLNANLSNDLLVSVSDSTLNEGDSDVVLVKPVGMLIDQCLSERLSVFESEVSRSCDGRSNHQQHENNGSIDSTQPKRKKLSKKLCSKTKRQNQSKVGVQKIKLVSAERNGELTCDRNKQVSSSKVIASDVEVTSLSKKKSDDSITISSNNVVTDVEKDVTSKKISGEGSASSSVTLVVDANSTHSKQTISNEGITNSSKKIVSDIEILSLSNISQGMLSDVDIANTAQNTLSDVDMAASHFVTLMSPPFLQTTDENSPRKLAQNVYKELNSSSLPASLSHVQLDPHDCQTDFTHVKQHACVNKMHSRRTVISVHSSHIPYIPHHCKKHPSRRIKPIFLKSPSKSRLVTSGVLSLNDSKKRKTLELVPDRQCEASLQEKEDNIRTQAISTKAIRLSDGGFPLSPSKRKPRRIKPILLSPNVNQNWSSSTSSGFYSPIIDDAKIVSSSSDFVASQSEEEAFRMLSLLTSSYTKPQPRQEITSTNQTLKCRCPKHQLSKVKKSSALEKCQLEVEMTPVNATEACRSQDVSSYDTNKSFAVVGYVEYPSKMCEGNVLCAFNVVSSTQPVDTMAAQQQIEDTTVENVQSKATVSVSNNNDEKQCLKKAEKESVLIRVGSDAVTEVIQNGMNSLLNVSDAHCPAHHLNPDPQDMWENDKTYSHVSAVTGDPTVLSSCLSKALIVAHDLTQQSMQHPMKETEVYPENSEAKSGQQETCFPSGCDDRSLLYQVMKECQIPTAESNIVYPSTAGFSLSESTTSRNRPLENIPTPCAPVLKESPEEKTHVKIKQKMKHGVKQPVKILPKLGTSPTDINKLMLLNQAFNFKPILPAHKPRTMQIVKSSNTAIITIPPECSQIFQSLLAEANILDVNTSQAITSNQTNIKQVDTTSYNINCKTQAGITQPSPSKINRVDSFNQVLITTPQLGTASNVFLSTTPQLGTLRQGLNNSDARFWNVNKRSTPANSHQKNIKTNKNTKSEHANQNNFAKTSPMSISEDNLSIQPFPGKKRKAVKTDLPGTKRQRREVQSHGAQCEQKHAETFSVDQICDKIDKFSRNQSNKTSSHPTASQHAHRASKKETAEKSKDKRNPSITPKMLISPGKKHKKCQKSLNEPSKASVEVLSPKTIKRQSIGIKTANEGELITKCCHETVQLSQHSKISSPENGGELSQVIKTYNNKSLTRLIDSQLTSNTKQNEVRLSDCCPPKKAHSVNQSGHSSPDNLAFNEKAQGNSSSGKKNFPSPVYIGTMNIASINSLLVSQKWDETAAQIENSKAIKGNNITGSSNFQINACDNYVSKNVSPIRADTYELKSRKKQMLLDNDNSLETINLNLQTCSSTDQSIICNNNLDSPLKKHLPPKKRLSLEAFQGKKESEIVVPCTTNSLEPHHVTDCSKHITEPNHVTDCSNTANNSESHSTEEPQVMNQTSEMSSIHHKSLPATPTTLKTNTIAEKPPSQTKIKKLLTKLHRISHIAKSPSNST